MKPTIKIQYILCISILICRSAFSQGTGNHITMFLQNCVQTSANTMEFDLMAMSDGATSSDLRANAFQYGINFNSVIINGGTITCSYIPATTDFPQLNGFNFPSSPFADHIRIIQEVYSQSNTGITMTVGHAYRVGRFRLTNTASWTPFSSPNFSLQATVAQCKTVCAGLTWRDSSTCPDAFYVTGTFNSQRALSVGCSLILLAPNELSAQSGISIYPNLIAGEGSIHISLQKNLSNGEVYILNALGEKVYEAVFNGKEKTINCKLSSGFYFVQVRDGEKQYAQKLVVQ